jgi:hypothetical protein
MKKFEYKEPEFNVVKASCEDVLTMSNFGGLDVTPNQSWVTATTGGDGGMIVFS